jgi:hypothetical protein
MRLENWRNLLHGHVPQAQQVLRRLIKPADVHAETWQSLRVFGVGTVQPVLQEILRKLASPRGAGFEGTPAWWLRGEAA